MVWIEFILSAAVITFAAMQLAKYGDVIGLRTGLGGMFVGTLLLAAATSLPELITTQVHQKWCAEPGSRKFVRQQYV